jgi:hypothetical protein
MVCAGALRFYKLGDWPFAGDETYTPGVTGFRTGLALPQEAAETRSSQSTGTPTDRRHAYQRADCEGSTSVSTGA